MKLLVVHASQFGSTKEIAEHIADVLRESGLSVDVEPASARPPASGYDAFIVGSAVHGGHWLKAATDFMLANQSTLSHGPVWLFSSGPIGDRAARSAQSDPAEVGQFSHWLNARDHRVFAGSFDRATADWTGLGVVERTVVRRFLPEGDWREWPAIDRWAQGISRDLAAATV